MYSARFKASDSTLTCTVKLTIYSGTCVSTLVTLKNTLPLNNSYVYGFLNGSLISKLSHYSSCFLYATQVNYNDDHFEIRASFNIVMAIVHMYDDCLKLK